MSILFIAVLPYLRPGSNIGQFSCTEYNSRIICMRSATSETIKFGRFELCAACVEYSTAPVDSNMNCIRRMRNATFEPGLTLYFFTLINSQYCTLPYFFLLAPFPILLSIPYLTILYIALLFSTCTFPYYCLYLTSQYCTLPYFFLSCLTLCTLPCFILPYSSTYFVLHISA